MPLSALSSPNRIISSAVLEQKDSGAQSYGITLSVSSKGNPYDNAIAEPSSSILKAGCIYRHKPKAFKEVNDLIGRYIHFYNHACIQLKTGVAPLTLRHSG